MNKIQEQQKVSGNYEIEWDNLVAIIGIILIALVAMATETSDNQIVTAVVSGMTGYIAKAAKMSVTGMLKS